MRKQHTLRAAGLAALLAIGASLGACATQPLPPAARLPTDAVIGAGDPMRAAIIEAASTFQQPRAQDPAQAARAAAMVEWMATDFRWGGRWSEFIPYAGPKLDEARAELRSYLGVAPGAPAQAVVDELFVASRVLRTGRAPALAPAVFPNPQQTLAQLASVPELPRVKEATAIVRQEMQRIENDRILNQNTGGGSGRD
jgi:hypothetical protein